ncbi:MAG: hypothetical protein GXP60_03260 [Epsilonproteobacteria bacterium]|nr:hypothetical protein [Campylobacterota bacterium]
MRLLLVASGYARPPFCLMIAFDKLSFFQRIYRKVGPNSPEPAFPYHNTDNAFLYLWPDRLRWNFLTVAIAISLPLLFYYQSQWWMSFITFLLLLVVFPCIIFMFFRIPVLGQLWKTWPANAKKSLASVAKIDLICHQQTIFGKITSRYFPMPGSGNHDAVFWSPANNTRQQAMLHMAICDMFKRHPKESALPDWQTKAFVRWIFYWAAPVWTGYFTLLILLLLTLFCFDNLHNKQMLDSLYFSGLLWNIFSIVFLWLESKRMYDWLSPQKRMFEMYLPPPAMNKFDFSPSLYTWFNEKLVQLIIAATNIIAGVFYLEIVKQTLRSLPKS